MARAVSVSSLYEGTPEEIFATLLERGKFAFQLIACRLRNPAVFHPH